MLQLRLGWYRALAHAVALAPLAWLGVRYLRDDLPVLLNRYLMLRSGVVALALLVAALACTPARILFNWRWTTLVRRTLGLYAFAYAVAHVVVYAQFENALDWRLIWRDLGERRSMAIGLASLAVLVPLALTSTTGWQRRLGTRWRTLHRLVYLAVPLAIAHYYYLDRDDRNPPLIYAVAVAGLLLLRLPPLRRAIGRLRAAR
jgi:sulfoxide reductase heme-binding subunit YedZ